MIRFVAGVAEVVEDVVVAVAYYRDQLGLEVEEMEGMEDTYAEVKIPGIGHFGIWDRRAAAESTFGDPGRADEMPLGFTLGFEVDDVGEAEEAIGNAIQGRQEEPWGQVTARFIGPSGAMFEVSETPWARQLGGESG